MDSEENSSNDVAKMDLDNVNDMDSPTVVKKKKKKKQGFQENKTYRFKIDLNEQSADKYEYNWLDLIAKEEKNKQHNNVKSNFLNSSALGKIKPIIM